MGARMLTTMNNNTKILDATLFVKKIVSLSPDKFEFISLELALERYHQYLFCVHDSGRKDTAKGFKEWLRTEI